MAARSPRHALRSYNAALGPELTGDLGRRLDEDPTTSANPVEGFESRLVIELCPRQLPGVDRRLRRLRYELCPLGPGK